MMAGFVGNHTSRCFCTNPTQIRKISGWLTFQINPLTIKVMPNLTYNLSTALQAHEQRRSALKQVQQDVQAGRERTNRNVWQSARLMTCIYPDATGRTEARLTNGATVSTVQDREPNSTHFSLAIGNLAKEQRLLNEHPITYVGPEVMDLLNIAIAKMDSDVIHPTDLTAPSGFIYLSKPIYLPDFHPETGEYDERAQYGVRAIAWHIERIGKAYGTDDVGPGVILNLYTDAGITKEVIEPGLRQIWEDEKDTPYPGIELDAPHHLMFPGDQHAWGFGMPWIVNSDLTATKITALGDSTVTPIPVANIRKWFLAFMRFCWQEIIVPRQPSNSDIPRQQRRSFERTTTVTNPINVVYLRRTREDGDTEPTEGYSLAYRVLVRGHWRNQWYPSLGPVDDPMSHRRIWIDPHVKGPDHAPFRDAVKVTAVVR